MTLGTDERFAPGEYERVERVAARMQAMGLRHIRLGIAWSDWMRQENTSWFEWLVPHLDQHFDVLPCLIPDALSASPPSEGHPDEDGYPAFVDTFATLFGEHFDAVELWDAPAGQDGALDEAARLVKGLGKRVVVGGPDGSLSPQRLEQLLKGGAADLVDVVAVPARPDSEADQWKDAVEAMREVLVARHSDARLWLTGAGHSTVRHDVVRQLETMQDVLDMDVERVYWHSTEDTDPVDSSDRFQVDMRDHHRGLWTRHRPKLAARILLQGRDPRELRWLVQEHAFAPERGHVVVTGGAGFVGTNLVHRLVRDGEQVLIVDDLSREGSLENLEWLRQTHGNALRVHAIDVRDRFAIERAIHGARAVFHLAGQVAVTTSLVDPREDFEINAEGTLNVLEAVRHHAPDAFVLYASTNKVYGGLEGVELEERATRWEPKTRRNTFLKARGQEHQETHAPARPLSFATPYGCSKGAADQYVLDYAHTFDLDSTVFRMSCIYGPHQNGTEDQGWLVHFLRSAAEGRPLTIYGDGKQVRDILHVDDLVEAYVQAMRDSAAVRGRAWDIGGGPQNTTSLRELMTLMRRLGCPDLDVRWEQARPSDQKHFVADIRPLEDALGWRPKTDVRSGIASVWRGMEQRQVIA